MSRPPRDPVETLKMHIVIHHYCNIAGITHSDENLLRYAGKKEFCCSKWRRIRRGEVSPSPNTYENMCEALQKHNISSLKITAFKQLYHSPFWHVLQTRQIDDSDEHQIISSLPNDIQKSIASKNWRNTRFYVRKRILPQRIINRVEKQSSLDALTALILLLRVKRESAESFDDTHIHSAVFRLLLSFCHHPSFFHYLAELWVYVKSVVVRYDEASLNRMGMSFWNYSSEELTQMLKDEANIHILAKKAYLIEDYTDVPSFNYLFYRNDDKHEMVIALKAIAANQRTSMKSLDNFFYTYRKLRRKGKCNLNFPTLSFPHLCIE